MTKVRVYWNLHKKMWSVQDTKTNKVIGHKQHITLWSAKFVVRKGGQKRVREQGKKNVHAFAVGLIADDKQQVYDSWNRVKYNPYTDDYFMYNRNDYNEWNEVPKDFVGFIHMESLEHEHGIVPRVYVSYAYNCMDIINRGE